jgi:hypothetical protein
LRYGKGRISAASTKASTVAAAAMPRVRTKTPVKANAGFFATLAHAVTQVLKSGVEERDAAGLAAFLFTLFKA